MSNKRVIKARRNMEGSVSQSLSEKGDLPGQQRDPQTVWMDYVYHDLSPSNRKIFEWTTGYNNTKRIPKKDIAAHLKISPAAVSMRVTGITKKLQQYTESERSRSM
jgi:DNA-binding NarL/FixJ family response regulator